METQSTYRVVYVATGERHIREAADSLRSLWHHHPSIQATMYVDAPSRTHVLEWGLRNLLTSGLCEIRSHPSPTYSWADKPLALSGHRANEERTLFLDTDTRVCGNLMEMFALLDAFELATAHAPIRFGPRQPAALRTRAPGAFPELNTGVIAYRETRAVRELLDAWSSLHRETLQTRDGRRLGDQATFRVALYHSDVRFAVLPPEYNCRFTFPTYLHGPVRILHGRGSDVEGVEREVNATRGPRVFVPGLGALRARPVPHRSNAAWG
jgi:hypothetical protein